MSIIIKSSRIQFKNPQIGGVSRAIKGHYFGRNVTATVDGEEKNYRFKIDEISFNADEDDMIAAIKQREAEEDSGDEDVE